MTQRLIEVVEDKIYDVLASRGDLETLQAEAKSRKEKVTEAHKLKDTTDLLLSGGRTSDGEKITWNDMFTSPEVRPYVPQAISNVLQMPVEPVAQIQTLYKPLSVGPGQSIAFPSVGALGDAEDMGEAEQYPVANKLGIQTGITALAGKVGLKVQFTQEARDLSRSATFDFVSLLLNSLRSSFSRTREKKAAHHFLRQGIVAMDNLSGSSTARRTSGRDPNGALNGTLLSDDLMLIWSEMVNDGYNPDAIVLPPLGWPAFMRDRELRTWAFNNGIPQMSQIYQLPTGTSGASRFNQPNPLQAVNDPFSEVSTLATTPNPNGIPFTLRPIVTPYAFYRKATSSSPAYMNIAIVDTNFAGYEVSEEDEQGNRIMTGEWVNPETDVFNFKGSEKYVYAAERGGSAVRVIRGVAVDRRAFDFLNNFSYSPNFTNPISGLGEVNVGGSAPVS